MNCDVAPRASAETLSQKAELTPGTRSRAPAKIVEDVEIPFAVAMACAVMPYVDRDVRQRLAALDRVDEAVLRRVEDAANSRRVRPVELVVGAEIPQADSHR